MTDFLLHFIRYVDLHLCDFIFSLFKRRMETGETHVELAGVATVAQFCLVGILAFVKRFGTKFTVPAVFET